MKRGHLGHEYTKEMTRTSHSRGRSHKQEEDMGKIKDC